MGDILVSVVIITYNSSSTICETLESVFNQSYNRLELIVSDDGSKDETVSIAKKWIRDHSTRFEHSEVITTPCNTGVPANLNRGIKVCKGDWVKTLAGDDLLLPDCIDKCILYIQSHPECNVVFSKMKYFRDTPKGRVILPLKVDLDNSCYAKSFVESDARMQFRLILRDDGVVQAPTAFYRFSFIAENPFPELYKYCEDYPMWLQLTRKGYKLDYMPEETVSYRFGDSLSNRKCDYYSKRFMTTLSLFFWNEAYTYFQEENLVEPYNKYRKRLLLYELSEAFTQNRPNKYHSLLIRIFNFLISKFAKYEL
jgi:alpha-1,3-rhamnosyltransferase